MAIFSALIARSRFMRLLTPRPHIDTGLLADAVPTSTPFVPPRKLAILGRYDICAAVRCHPFVQRRQPNARNIRNLPPCQPPGQRNSHCILTEVIRSSLGLQTVTRPTSR